MRVSTNENQSSFVFFFFVQTHRIYQVTSSRSVSFFFMFRGIGIWFQGTFHYVHYQSTRWNACWWVHLLLLLPNGDGIDMQVRRNYRVSQAHTWAHRCIQNHLMRSNNLFFFFGKPWARTVIERAKDRRETQSVRAGRLHSLGFEQLKIWSNIRYSISWSGKCSMKCGRRNEIRNLSEEKSECVRYHRPIRSRKHVWCD